MPRGGPRKRSGTDDLQTRNRFVSYLANAEPTKRRIGAKAGEDRGALSRLFVFGFTLFVLGMGVLGVLRELEAILP